MTPSMEQHDLLTSLSTVFTKLQNPSSTQIGFELFKRLVFKNVSIEHNVHFILNNISSQLSSLPLNNTREPFIKLITFIFQNNLKTPVQKASYYPYISPSLSLLQAQISNNNSSIYPSISNAFADITLYTMITDIESSQDMLGVDERKHYETLQGFCIYNMKEPIKANQICGSLCLTKLVENCPIVLQSKYLKFIWENIMSFIDHNDFNAKYELLNCLISLILGAEAQFKPHAVVTLFKVMEFLTDNDWLKRKLALNVIYTIAFYCKDEIASMKTQLISFLKLLKGDKVKDVRDIAVSILTLLNETELNESEGNKKRKRAKSPTNAVVNEVNVNRKDDSSVVSEKMPMVKSGKNTAFVNAGYNKEDLVEDIKAKQRGEEGTDDKEMSAVENDVVNVSQHKHQKEAAITTNKLTDSTNKSKHINSKSNSEMISALLSQMNILSSKQIQLLDTISQIQNDTQSQINTLNTKITSLESTLSSLSSQLVAAKPKPSQSDINAFFKQALSQENTQEILSLLSKTPLSQIKNVNVDLIEDTIERLIPLLSKGDEVKQIISFYKTVLLALRLPLRSEVVQHVKDALEYVTRSGVDGGYGGNISEEEMIDISIILSSLIESK